MIELVLNKIRVDESRNEQVIIFREKDGNRFLPVVIGLPEVNAIKIKLSGITPPRPLTHDLILRVIELLGARLDHMVIDKLENNTFYAKLMLAKAGEELIPVDARPSDSVAVALRAGVPIYAAEEIMGEASVTEV